MLNLFAHSVLRSGERIRAKAQSSEAILPVLGFLCNSYLLILLRIIIIVAFIQHYSRDSARFGRPDLADESPDKYERR